MKIGIVGNGEDKFTINGKDRAFTTIYRIFLDNPNCVLVSGHSPVGGIDIWAETEAKMCNISMDLKIPKQHKWDAEYGYKQRNLDIAKDSDELHIILVDKYPENYQNSKFEKCYHCNTSDHVKSGACWTAKEARKLGKKVIYHIIKND
jgi:hypothetical protein